MDEIIGFDEQIGSPLRRAFIKTPVRRAATPATPVRRAATPATPIKSAARPVMPARSFVRPATPAQAAARPAQIPLKKASPARGGIFSKIIKKPVRQAAVIKPSGQVVPVSKLIRTTNPAQVQAASPIQRSFMPVDLPYQKQQPASKPLKLTATNYKLSTNINLIEPPVDSGVANYYGK